ncbi:MAG: alpha/beta fold hydrolase [Actinomycetota bacterium]
MPTFRSGNADIAYDVTGEGEPLLMIMGFGADSRMWMLQTAVFAKRYRCITFDNRGVGGSSLPDGRVSMGMMADDAIALLDHLGIGRAHVLGISMGGAIAQHVALRAPERVRTLILAATWCAKNPYTERIAELGRGILRTLGREALVRSLMLWLFTPGFLINNAESADAVEALFLQFPVPENAFLAQLDALLQHDVSEHLGSLQVPTRVLTGRRDTLVPPELCEQLAAAIPKAELVVTETGHAFNVEEMDVFNRSVLEFLDRH